MFVGGQSDLDAAGNVLHPDDLAAYGRETKAPYYPLTPRDCDSIFRCSLPK